MTNYMYIIYSYHPFTVWHCFAQFYDNLIEQGYLDQNVSWQEWMAIFVTNWTILLENTTKSYRLRRGENLFS